MRMLTNIFNFRSIIDRKLMMLVSMRTNIFNFRSIIDRKLKMLVSMRILKPDTSKRTRTMVHAHEMLRKIVRYPDVRDGTLGMIKILGTPT